MRRKVEGIATDLSNRLAGWGTVDTITLIEPAEEELYSPYYFLSLDVYYSGSIPPEEDRQKLFSDAGAFESSSTARKDRFFINELPVRIEYKEKERIDLILDRIKDNLWVFRQTGTYMFYRLQEGTKLSSRSQWLDGIQGRLKQLPDTFWSMLARASTSTMEHYLIDMKAADMENDSFFYLISSAGFIKSLASSLFIVNHRFEPSGRRIKEHLLNLPILPENFRGLYESIMGDDPDFTHSRKCEMAEILAKSVFRMI